MNEVSKINNGGQISFTVRTTRPLTFHQRKVMGLIESCLSKAIVLDSYILQDWFVQEIVQPRKRIVSGDYLGYRNENGNPVYEKIPEYDLMQREIKKHDGLLPHWYLCEAKQILKNCIGALVVKGYLMAIPNVKIDNIPEGKSLENINS